RTVYLAFGHDEEIGGEHGAAKVAELLAAEGVMADFVLDEGGVIGVGLIDGVPVPTATIMVGEKGFVTVRLSTSDVGGHASMAACVLHGGRGVGVGQLDGVPVPTATIRVGEKGFVTVRLSTSDVGGHASMPPRRTAVGRLARAVAALQDKPMPLRVTEPVREMVARVAPYLPGVRGTLLAKVAKWDKALARVLAMRPQTASLVRTTTAPTVIRGGVKPNVLPQTAEAFVNFRILHGDTVDDVLAHCRRVVRDKQVSVELAPGERAEPSPVSSTDSPRFRLLGELTTAVVPEAAVTTGLVPGATDARHYHRVARERFGFAPILMDSTELDRIHGTDERLSLDNYARLIWFTGQFMRL